jgi:hypothetical protein
LHSIACPVGGLRHREKTENIPAALIDSVVRNGAKLDPIPREVDPLGPALSTMHAYHFTLRNDGAQVDDLGFMGLADDDEALVFGKQVIRDLKGGDRNYAGWIMDITEGERPVGNIPFE